MAIDGLFLRHLKEEMAKDIIGARISKVSMISNLELLLTIRTNNKETKKLLISCSSSFARIHFSTNSFVSPYTPYNLTITLRKHLEGGIISDISQIGNDRVLVLDILKNDELGDPVTKKLYIEIMGKHSNAILVQDNLVIDSIKRVSPSMSRFRVVLPKANYYLPETTKLDPFVDKIKSIDDIYNYQGLSKQTFQEINYTKNLDVIYNPEIIPTLFKGKKDNFYFCSLHNDLEEITYDSLSSLLDTYYFNKDILDRNKQQNNDLTITVKSKVKQLAHKIEKLRKQLDDSSKAEKYQLYGELLLNNNHNIQKGSNRVKVLNYYTNEEIEITLDPKLNAIDNSNKYYQKAKKLKTSVSYLEEQITIAKSDLKYFNSILEQLSYATDNDIDEIREELIKSRYLKPNKKKVKKRKKPNYLTFKLKDDLIYVGKNNIQNSFLTHKLANPQDYWFHIKGGSGSHVILRTTKLTEENIRACANLAALYSKFNKSSSVPVDYTKKKFVKKIPKEKDCFVQYTNEKTIFIDPDSDLINNLQQVK